MVRHGFSPHEARVTATANPARWLGMERRRGTIAPGAHADLSFVEGDPLADIWAAAVVRSVMIGGTVHTADDFLRPFVAPAAAAPVMHPAVSHRATDHEGRRWHRPEWMLPMCCGIR